MSQQSSPDASQLGALEAEVMRVVWTLEHATVHDVSEHVEWDKKLAYTTVMTVLTRLADKGFLTREKKGRGYVYRPRVGQRQIGWSALRSVVDRFFGGARSGAVAQLLSDADQLSDEELAELERLIRQAREDRGDG